MTTERKTRDPVDLMDDDLDDDDLDEMDRWNDRFAKRLRKMMASSHCLVLAEVGGRMWASNSHWLVPAERLEPYLDRYNVSREPGLLRIRRGRPGRPDTAPVPDISKIYREAVDVELVSLTRHHLVGCPAFIPKSGIRFDVFRRPDGADVAVNSKYLELCDPYRIGDVRQSAANDRGSLVAYSHHGEPYGLVLPVTLRDAPAREEES